MKKTILWGLTAAWVLFVGLFSIPLLQATETALMPVVKDFTFTKVSRTASGYVINVQGVKLRDCKFLRIETAGFPDNNGPQELATTDFLDSSGQLRPTLSRVTGAQDFGQWYVHPSFGRYVFVAKHSCHSLWETTTPIGEFKP